VAGLAQVEPDPVACDLIFVGRHIPHKHVDDFLEAAARITQARQAQGRQVPTLKVVGGGPLEPAARARAHALGLAPQLRHWGEIEDHREVVAHIRSAAILVLPSTREGFGLVLTEALAGGTAVVAYDIPAVRETVGPALREVLVPAEDVQALADVITRLLDDPAHRAALVAAGQAHVSAHFEVRDFATRVLAVYAATRARHRAA
jgi:glycosyltransferase involved in cell wall biosynthesis